MAFTLSDLARALNARLEGDADLTILRAAEPGAAGPDDLAVALEPRFAERLTKGRARAAVLWDGADWQALGLEGALFLPASRNAMAALTQTLDPGPEIAPGIHPSAVIDPAARIGEGAAIAPLAVIGAGAQIGARARIGAHVSIAAGAVIGEDVLLHPGVRIGARVWIGARFIAQPGVVIGGDGFSFIPVARGASDAPPPSRIHSLGGVRIGDDVEIGALSVVDRGTIKDTVIGNGTKIDNQVQIAHNVEIGDNCLICGQAGVAGSARVGNRVVLGGRTAVNDNIFVGDDVVAAGATNIFSNAPAGRILMGSPAMKAEQHMELLRAMRRLPRWGRKLEALQADVAGLLNRAGLTPHKATKGPSDGEGSG